MEVYGIVLDCNIGGFVVCWMYFLNYGIIEMNGIELDFRKLCNVIFLNNKVYVIFKFKFKNWCEREGERDREIIVER